MGKCSVKKVSIFVSWALMLAWSSAERDDFLVAGPRTWDEARKYCQDCFKDLVTVSSENIVAIANTVSAASWIGLQKNNNAWLRWANGEPLTFQNWHPGTRAQSQSNTSCVAVLTLGVWVERNCQESLPFICYEDRFVGRVTLTELGSSSVTLSWLAGPGRISQYRLEVEGGQNLIVTGTVFVLSGLTPGSSHSVRVFPVKCQKELHPAQISFCTIPSRVENLRVSVATESSLSLAWTKPSGKVDFYQVEVDGQKIRSTVEEAQVMALTPGRSYTVRVQSAVQDGKNLSAESTITAFTKPAKVTDLLVSENTNSSMKLTWELPVGEATAFKVEAKISENVLFEETVTAKEARVTGLPMGAQVNLSVSALAGDSLGDAETVIGKTVLGQVSNLSLATDSDSLSATWSPLEAADSSFTVALQLEGHQVEVLRGLLDSKVKFSRLEKGARYTLSVSIVTGGFASQPAEASAYTSLPPPSNVKVVSFNKSHIAFTWTDPPDSKKFSYAVRISSPFWGYSHSETVQKKNSHTFSGLTSGTRYELEVRTVLDKLSSEAANVSHSTVADKMEVSLAMLCSSAESLLCDRRSTREDVFNQLHAWFHKRFRDDVFWQLQEQHTEN